MRCITSNGSRNRIVIVIEPTPPIHSQSHLMAKSCINKFVVMQMP